MNVNLAFTPNTHFEKWQDFGNDGAAFPSEFKLTVPVEFYKRIVYLQFGTDPAGGTFLLTTRLTFTLNGQVTGEIPLKLTSSSSGGIQFGDGASEDGIVAWVGDTPVQLNIAPFEVICACNQIKLTIETQTPATLPGTHRPIWFFGVKSMHHW